jgi:predicted metal-binding protein
VENALAFAVQSRDTYLLMSLESPDDMEDARQAVDLLQAYFANVDQIVNQIARPEK